MEQHNRLKDARGTPVPDTLALAFGQLRPECERAAKLAEELQSVLEGLRDDFDVPLWVTTKDLDNLIRQLHEEQPDWVCPKCCAQDKLCVACRGRGWIGLRYARAYYPRGAQP